MPRKKEGTLTKLSKKTKELKNKAGAKLEKAKKAACSKMCKAK